MPMLPSFHNAGRLLTKVQAEDPFDLREQRPDKRPIIIRMLADQIKSKKPVLEIIIHELDYRYDPKFHLIYDKSGNINTIGEMLEKNYGIRRSIIKCTVCNDGIPLDICFYHWQNGLHYGHSLNIQQVIDQLALISN